MKEIVDKIINADVMLFLIVITIIAGMLFKVNYFNIVSVIKGYFSVFKNSRGKFNIGGLLITFALPLWLSIYILSMLPEEKIDYETELLIVTILTALFFSVFGIIFTLKERLEDKNKSETMSASKKENLKKLVDSITSINMMEIVLSIFILILCFMSNIVKEHFLLFNFMIYYLLFWLLMNIFILIKRLQVTINDIS